MDDLFLAIFLLTPIAWIVAMIRPGLFSKIPIKNLNRKKLTGILLALFIVSFVGFGVTSKPVEENVKEEVQSSSTEEQDTNVSSVEVEGGVAVVKRVVDGDTIELDSGAKVRYIGIDTPESVDPKKPVECYAEAASKKNRELVEGKEVRLEKDVSETDRYGRLLRYIWINDSLINEILVREGYARSSTYPPDVKYQERFQIAEKVAREEKLGLWGEECVIKPTPTLVPSAKPTVYIAPTKAPTTYYVAPTSVPYVAPTNLPAAVNQQTGGQPGGGGTSGSWSCDCSKTCPNMSSCAEAYFQLNNCGCSIRDGDDDGVPCESICSGG